MITFKTISVKNFLSYGNNTTELGLDQGLVRLIGQNGSGKSTIPLDALNFVLYGKPYRKIKLSQLINSKNKNGLFVALDFIKNEDTFRIERGLKPDIFKIYKNDELVPVSSTKRGYQEILEQDILCLTENLFNQIIVKSLTKNISFIPLPKAEKRSIIENIFDIEIFSEMGKKIKEKLDEIKIELQNTQNHINTCEKTKSIELAALEQLKTIKHNLETKHEQEKQEKQDEIEQIESQKTILLSQLEKLNTIKIQKESLNESKKNIEESIEKLTEEKNNILLETRTIKAKITSLQEMCSDCPRIKTMIEDESIPILEKRYKEIITEAKPLLDDVDTLKQKIKDCDDILKQEYVLENQITTANRDIKKLQTEITKEVNHNIVIDETNYKECVKQLKELKSKYNEIDTLKTNYLLLKDFCGDNGFKVFIIKKYLPTINKFLDYYLNKFQTDIRFHFDEDFSEVVLGRFNSNFSYYNFSEGQKKRIDLAIMFSFINFSLYKNKNSTTNLLVLDEVTSGLDDIGKECLFDVLREFNLKDKKSIISITPNELNIDKYDKLIEAKTQNGFSFLKDIQ